MSSISFTWVTEGGDLGTADWGCLAGRCASLCLQAAHGALVSDESASQRRVRDDALYKLTTFTFFFYLFFTISR